MVLFIFLLFSSLLTTHVPEGLQADPNPSFALTQSDGAAQADPNPSFTLSQSDGAAQADQVPQASIPTVSSELFDQIGVIWLGHLPGWKISFDDSTGFRSESYDDRHWPLMQPDELRIDTHLDENGYFKGWLRFVFTVDSTLTPKPLFFRVGSWGAVEAWINGHHIAKFGSFSDDPEGFRYFNPLNQKPVPIEYRFYPDSTYVLSVRMEHYQSPLTASLRIVNTRLDPWIRFTDFSYIAYLDLTVTENLMFNVAVLAALLLMLMLTFTLYLLNRHDLVIRDSAIFMLLLFCGSLLSFTQGVAYLSQTMYILLQVLGIVSIMTLFFWLPILLNTIVTGKTNRKLYLLFLLPIPLTLLNLWFSTAVFNFVVLIVGFPIAFWIIKNGWRSLQSIDRIIFRGLIIQLIIMGIYPFMESFYVSNDYRALSYFHGAVIYLFFSFTIIYYLSIRYTNNFKSLRMKIGETQKLSEENLQKEREKQVLISRQNEVLEKEVELRTRDLQESLSELQAAQQQLVQQEKLASLGQLTAGIAHEIKNPLNFVNNFSSVSVELIDEALQEVSQIESDELRSELSDILEDVKMNLSKITEHGSRADRIVKSMLLHSRGGNGKRESTDVNVLLKEYVNLAFHGMRAGKNPISSEIVFELDPNAGSAQLIAEDFSRVVLNISNNAFDAMRDKLNQTGSGYNPVLTVRTRKNVDGVTIEIEDNGPGIPDEIRDKILQPFFTTKKGTEGTGLGLSITHDIIKAHGGTLDVVSSEGTGTTFVIHLP